MSHPLDDGSHIEPETYGYLMKMVEGAREIEAVTGRSPDYIAITPGFADRLSREGFLPGFDWEVGLGSCVWNWMLFGGIRIVSRCGVR